ncbi:MAG: xanthine dehydrogenase family protein molybdopterin-binding subunit [Proteobacteria bacterium]|nr:xanthine dehydrogenase family protein molybdopterin-binding subunit [Pseudomonadota bacterium]
MNNPITVLGRRDFLKVGLAASSGLWLGLRLDDAAALDAPATGDFAPNAFVRIGRDDSVTVIAKHLEMGQGVHTGLATLLVEELDADWAQLRIEAAPADASRYNNLKWGPYQGTGGSSSISNAWLQMREAGAMARALLVSAAAAQWQVDAGEVTVVKGRVRHAASQRESGFGALVDAAARLPLPGEVKLKAPRDFVYIGKSAPRSDGAAKSRGAALYTIDLRLPGMRHAVMLHPPRFGATPAKVDDTAARAVPGVHAVLRFDEGVAVVADSLWVALRGRDALAVEWNDSAALRLDSEAQRQDYRERAARAGQALRNDGDVEAALGAAPSVVEATYEVPYLAHASMEPMNCVAQLGEHGCDLWYGAQSLTSDQAKVAALLDIAPTQVRIHQQFAGGSFGRRADIGAGYVLEAVRIARALGDGRPVKLQWTREDDMRGGRYRPAATHALRGALSADGELTAWQQRIVCQSLWGGDGLRAGKVDKTIHEGASDLPYRVTNLCVEAHVADIALPVLWWRSVGHTHTAFAVECFIDELAHAAGKDPVALRRALLRDDPRRLAVLDLAARESGWGTALPAGRGRGIAVHRSFGTWVAEVVEVSTDADGGFKVERVTVAVDCGLAINPDVIRAQMEGGVGYALSAALAGEITLKDGVVQESNFDTYPLLRMSQMPPIEVHIVASEEAPSGVGEPAVPPLAPALANALFAATGKRQRRLPFRGGV